MIESSQFKDGEKTVLEVGRKRCFENEPTVEEEPPAKKGKISTIAQQGVFHGNLITILEQKQKVVERKSYVIRRKSVLNCKWK